jgi:hypothetical protein
LRKAPFLVLFLVSGRVLKAFWLFFAEITLFLGAAAGAIMSFLGAMEDN